MNKENIALRLTWLALGVLIGVVGVFYGSRFLEAKTSGKTNSAADSESGKKSSAIAAPFTGANVDELISIEKQSDALSKREELRTFIWGQRGFPDSLLPNKIQSNITDTRYEGLKNLKEINKLSILMEWGFISTAYHFVPIQGNNKLVIYHQGHDGDFIGGLPIIRFFLERGFAVIGLSMPLEPPNNRPTVDLKRFGKIKLTFHDQLKMLEMKSGHPIQLFLTPVAVSLNYAERFQYGSVYMTGVSGGGWTTTVYSAIDPRITRSYPVAGTLPFQFKGDERREYMYTSQPSMDWGDYEQSAPELYRIANYLELYVLGSNGTGRKQIQVLNEFDPCCFAGKAYSLYEDSVKERVRMLGPGEFDVHLDSTHNKHMISDHALKVILDDINGMPDSIPQI